MKVVRISASFRNDSQFGKIDQTAKSSKFDAFEKFNV